MATAPPLNVPYLSIAVLAAKGLEPKDRSGLSDPFCEIRLTINKEKEEPKFSTRAINQTLDPGIVTVCLVLFNCYFYYLLFAVWLLFYKKKNVFIYIVWNERFMFINKKLVDPTAEITLKLFDQNRFSQPQFEGIVHLKIHELLGAPQATTSSREVVEKWLPLQPYQGNLSVS